MELEIARLEAEARDAAGETTVTDQRGGPVGGGAKGWTTFWSYLLRMWTGAA